MATTPPDWADLTREDRVTVTMVSPTDVGQSYGTLDGVDLSASSLTCGYYTDTRTAAQLRVVGDGWVRGSMLRVTHEVPEWGWRRDLGTYIVTADPSERVGGEWVTDLRLDSRLYGLSTDRLVRPWTIAKGARAVRAMEDVLRGSGGIQYHMDSPRDMTYRSARAVESGTTRLAALFDICSASKNRLDVDAQGRVTVAPYVEPSARVASYRIDLADTRGIVADGPSRSTDWLGMSDVAAVSHRYHATSGGKSVDREIVGVARVSAALHQSHAKRGYTVTSFRQVSELSPRTQARADALARADLAREQRELVEWQLTCCYLPLWQGDVCELVVHDGPAAYQGMRRCLVKAMDIQDLRDMTMRLTLKEVASGDKGDED